MISETGSSIFITPILMREEYDYLSRLKNECRVHKHFMDHLPAMIEMFFNIQRIK